MNTSSHRNHHGAFFTVFTVKDGGSNTVFESGKGRRDGPSLGRWPGFCRKRNLSEHKMFLQAKEPFGTLKSSSRQTSRYLRREPQYIYIYIYIVIQNFSTFFLCCG
jgi:hypothetical protein